jgi:ABC-type branched-subunit amino acid transport system ATPase component
VVTFDGRDVTRVPPEERAHLGLCRTFQSLELFEDLTVRDNLLAAAERPHWFPFAHHFKRWRGQSIQAAEQVNHALRILDIEAIADTVPVDLSHGQRKLASVARALAAQPKLLLLDEPAAGLDTNESQLLGRRLRTFLADGVTIFLIDHDMGLVLNVCDFIYVLDFGRIIAAGTPVEVRRDPAVIAAYLGQSARDRPEPGIVTVMDELALHSAESVES